jgi:kynureninase
MIIGAQLHEVAVAPSVSVALSSIATALDYSERNNVVMADMDFPTLAYQWLVKERLGVECRFVESPDRIYTPPELFEREVDSKTALVATSRVIFTSGYIQDVRAVADIAHKHGAYILIDDYQGTGQIPIDVIKMDIDLPTLHLVRSIAYYLMVAAYLIPPSSYDKVASSMLLLTIGLSPRTVEGVSVHDFR